MQMAAVALLPQKDAQVPASETGTNVQVQAHVQGFATTAG